MDNKDWGMAEFFSSRLESLVNSLVDYYKNLKRMEPEEEPVAFGAPFPLKYEYE